MSAHLDLILLVVLMTALMAGYPVALTLGGISVLFALIGSLMGGFDLALFFAIPSRIFGIVTNQVLLAIPMFVVMGLVLEKSRIADEMLTATAALFKETRGGLTVSVTIVGMLLAASTGIVGASVVTLGLLALPGLLRAGVPASLAGGSVAAAGTLGQIIPPSIVLIVLGDQISNAWQEAQTRSGNFAPETVSVADLFAGALLPGLLLVCMYVIYQLFASIRFVGNGADNHQSDPLAFEPVDYIRAFFPPLALIIAVLGSILAGIATPSEAASVGAVGAFILARNKLSFVQLKEVLQESLHLVSMIFLIVIGATLFSLVFRGLGGDETISDFLTNLPGGTYGAIFIVMAVIFILGFFLDFLEICFIVVPLVAPALLMMPMADGSTMSPIWLGVLIALNLQTSFLTPPFGLSLFYLRSVAVENLTTLALYKGVIPFVMLQILALLFVLLFPMLATFLPHFLYSP